MTGSNYIIYEREFIKTKENIYKIGKTEQPMLDRFAQYPKGSQLMVQKLVSDCAMVEKEIMEVFDIKFINRRDIGREYYEGDVNEMIKEFDEITKKYIQDIKQIKILETNPKKNTA